MERLWADSSGQDSYDPYTCAVNNALFLECLDIAGPRTLGNSLSDSVAYNMSGSNGDLNKNFYAVLALEGLLNMTGENATGHFGGDVSCNGKVVGDGAVNAYDIATIMWYQFKFEPYDQLPDDPSMVATVQGRDDTGYRCNLGETRRMWQLSVGEDYCHSGQNANMLGYDSQRRLSHAMVPERSILSANLFEAYRSEPLRPKFRQLDATVESTVSDAKEARGPSERRSTINGDDMLRTVNAMRTLDIDVAEWGVVAGHGRWIRLRAPGVQIAMELYLSGVSVDEPVHLSLQGVPEKNCTTCQPIDEDSRGVVIAFARRTEYEDEYSSAVNIVEQDICANIVPATVQSSVMLGNTIAVRQQPPSRACGFDIFVWIPSFPKAGIHVSKYAAPYSFSARRLAAVGAESALVASMTGCESDIGVLAGSSAMDGFRGQIQRLTSCARYGFTKPELIKPAVTTVVPAGQCAATACNLNAPARSNVVSRSFHLFASSGLESAYTNSLQMLAMTPRGQDQQLAPYNVVYNKYVAFERALARDSQGSDCCTGYVCVATIDLYLNMSASCQLQSNQPSPSPPTLPPPSTPPPMEKKVVFGVVVAGEAVQSFNRTDYKIRVSLAAGVPLSCIALQIQDGNVTTTIRLEYDSVITAQDVKTNLDNTLAYNNSMASIALGVTVEKIFATPAVYTNYYSPPPPTPPRPDAKEDNLGLILGLTLGTTAFLALVAMGICLFCCGRVKVAASENKESQPLKKPSYEYNDRPSAKSASSYKAKNDRHTLELANVFAKSVGSESKMAMHAKAGQPRRVTTGSVPLIGL